MAKLPDRFEYSNRSHIARTCSVEALVGLQTAMAVLFHGKDVRSPATRRVEAWAKREGFRIGQAKTPPPKDVDEVLSQVEAAEMARGA